MEVGTLKAYERGIPQFLLAPGREAQASSRRPGPGAPPPLPRSTLVHRQGRSIGCASTEPAPAVYLFIGLMDGERSVDELWSAVVTQLGDDAPTPTRSSISCRSSTRPTSFSPTYRPMPGSCSKDTPVTPGRSSGGFGSLLSIKLPVLDPDRFLERTAGVVRPLLGWAGALLWLAVVLPALILAGIHWPELTGDFIDRIPTTRNLLTIALVFPVLKTLHELGHGYATKVSGGSVHEIGIMLLVFAPVPYVDASASAAFRSEWRDESSSARQACFSSSSWRRSPSTSGFLSSRGRFARSVTTRC